MVVNRVAFRNPPSHIVRLQQRRKQTVTHGYTSHRDLQQAARVYCGSTGPNLGYPRYGSLSHSLGGPSLLSPGAKPAHSLKPVRVTLHG